jgi:hypothetical protein
MKIGILRAIAHNVADSLGSGIGLLIGVYEMDVFGEAKRSPSRSINIDFLKGNAIGGRISSVLAGAVTKYREVLPKLCAKHGATIDDFKMLTAEYSSSSRRIVVTVQDRIGRRYVDEYVGTPAKHVKVLDKLGRVRTRRRSIRSETGAKIGSKERKH